MHTFEAFTDKVARELQHLVQDGEVYVSDVEGDALWEIYLGAFPPGTDPLFKKRTEHDCSVCRGFIRHVGGMVSLQNGGIQTIWDGAAAWDGAYGTVAKALQAKLRVSGIRNIFRVGLKETQFGAKITRSVDSNQKVQQWHHFYTGKLPAKLCVALPDTARGEFRTTFQVFERGLVGLRPDAVETVRSLIQENALYRGEEHKALVQEFHKLQSLYLALTKGHSQFLWANIHNFAARFKNTVIGTLVQDLSDGVGIDTAVRSFEAKVAPTNYKRTTAIITPMMVKKAMETITQLDLEPALERRFANITDVSVEDVLWVNGSTRPQMKGGIGDLLMAQAKAPPKATPSLEEEHISIDAFIADVLPKTQSAEIFLANRHTGNLAVLTAPVHSEVAQLFRWDNAFAWSYRGNVTDSIKDRVKKAGGTVEGELRVSLSWFNFDDLDLHIDQPQTRSAAHSLHPTIFFYAKQGWTGGILDVDMNAGTGRTRTPVENVIWGKGKKIPDGAYTVKVNNYCQRETSDPGFVVEVESAGKIHTFTYNKQVRNAETIQVAVLHMKNNMIERISDLGSGVSSSELSQNTWGLKTETYEPVSTVMYSPNYWGKNKVGNKHVFLILEKARADEDMRGIYNEFLHPRLEPHRKVFEVLGEKTKCRPTEMQLAGLGFSSTKPDEFLVRVQQGSRRRLLNVIVGVYSFA